MCCEGQDVVFVPSAPFVSQVPFHHDSPHQNSSLRDQRGIAPSCHLNCSLPGRGFCTRAGVLRLAAKHRLYPMIHGRKMNRAEGWGAIFCCFSPSLFYIGLLLFLLCHWLTFFLVSGVWPLSEKESRIWNLLTPHPSYVPPQFPLCFGLTSIALAFKWYMSYIGAMFLWFALHPWHIHQQAGLYNGGAVCCTVVCEDILAYLEHKIELIIV